MPALLESRSLAGACGAWKACKIAEAAVCSLSLSSAHGNFVPGLLQVGRRGRRSCGFQMLKPRERESLALGVFASLQRAGAMAASVASVESGAAGMQAAAAALELGLESEFDTKSKFLVPPGQTPVRKKREPGNGYGQTKLGRPTTGALEVDGFSIEGVSVGGQETCVMLPALKVAFDIGRCPERAIHQDFLFITHPHMDHIGGLTMYVASRDLLKMKVPAVIVPKCVKATVEKLFAVQRELDDSPLPVNLIGMDIGEEFNLGKGFVVKAFKTYHVVPSQGYVIYSVKQKLKVEYVGLSGAEIKALKASGAEVTETVKTPEVAFTGDTTSQFILDDANKDALSARLLIMESTFLDGYMSVENANEYGHMHLFEVMALADRFKNKNLLLIHFSARYSQEDIFKAIEGIPPPLQGRVLALTEGF